MSAVLIMKLAIVTGVFSFASIELGAEFFTAVNTALNMITVIYLQRQAAKVKAISNVAETLDTRRAGGRRELDPYGCEDVTGDE